MSLIRPATPDAVQEAAGLLRQGCLVAFPTETVYGLGADATNAMAVGGIFEAKGRPRFNPLIAHIADLEAALELAAFTPEALNLARAFWPGPLTLVLPMKPDGPLAELVTAGLATVAIRAPAGRTAQALLAAFGRPIAAPSANRSGHVSPTTATHVMHDLYGRIDMILDDGPCSAGLESTIVDTSGPSLTILREGALPKEDLEAKRGAAIATDGAVETVQPKAPGRLESHYAPSAYLRLNATHLNGGEALLAFGPDPLSTNAPILNLSVTGNLREAAANLFAHLRDLDAKVGDGGVIAVMPIPETGLGAAINDRLKRAAAPRLEDHAD